MKTILIIIAISAAFTACSGNSISESVFPSRTVTVGGHKYKFRIFVPKDRDPDAKIPVMLYLHGSGARGDDNQAQVGEIAPLIREHPERFPFIVVFPQCRPELFWAGEMTDQAIAALDQTVMEFDGDADRLYLAGFSMGGFGVWQTAVTYPSKFAALVPIAGGIKPQGPLAAEEKAMLSDAVRKAADSDDPYKSFADAIGDTPVWIFHGEADDVVSPEGSRQMAETLRSSGNRNVRYTELQGVGHWSVQDAFNDLGLHGWLAEQNLRSR